ncbi:ricin-type beta-trefoil lectin domain protein [Kitasatospora sp. NPDC001540]|uniref:ricin-type beta-trefoil lectin domain protein n=1 Tax=Kitasatospora sp. NPDC001540 TaxID=3364014 RepID=UPI0036D0FD37
MPRLVSLAACGALGLGFFGVPAAHADPATASPTASPSSPSSASPVVTPEQQAIQDARARARSTGQPVVVDAMTTESSRTVANPNGTLTTTDNAQAVRTRRAGAWVDLDPTLHRNADGTISPAATQDSLTLSGGGTGPFATITTSDGKKLAVTAPFPLPAPSLDGATATYAGVLPDVDLQVSALSNGGWRDVIVVRTAAAAADPRLATLHFPVTTTGLTVAADPAGNVSFKDSGGEVRFQAPTPLQWDSTVSSAVPLASGGGAAAPRSPAVAPQDTPQAAGSNAAGPGATAVVASMGVAATGSGIDLIPDKATFGKGTGPWYLDPTVGAVSKTIGATQVQEYLPTSTYYSTGAQDLGIGYCGYPNCPGHGRERAYFTIGVSANIYTQPSGAPAPPTVYDSKLSVNVDGASAPDTNTPIGLYWTGTIDDATTWKNQPCNGGGTFGGCGKVGGSQWIKGTGPINFDVTAQMRQAASQKWGTWTVGLAPDDETNMSYRHHVQSSISIATNYDITPSAWWPRSSPSVGFANSGDGKGTPTGADCPGSADPGWIGAAENIALTVSQWSPIGVNLTDKFATWDDTTGSALPTLSTPASAYGNNWVNLPGSLLTDGHRYRWQATTTDDSLTSPVVGPCYFRFDRTAPTVSVSSAQFPPSGSPAPATLTYAGQSGTFTVTGTDPAPAGGGDTSGLACYRISTASTPVTGWHCNDATTTSDTVALPDATGRATYAFTPPHWGTNTLFVQAQDNAGNYSQPAAYSFYAPWNPAHGPTYGDITGDQRPDILLPDGNGGLRLVQNTADPVNAGWLSGSAATSPTGTWQNVQTTHRSSLRGGVTVDDLIAHPAGNPQLFLYQNAGTGSFNTRTSFYLNGTTTQGPVTCTNADGLPVDATQTSGCPSDLGTDWSGATQVLAVGSPDNETTTPTAKTSVLAVIDSKLWLFSPGSNNIRLLATKDTRVSSLDWSDYDLIGPGPANGTTTCTSNGTTATTAQTTLWARERSTGRILAYPITKNPNNGCANDYSALSDPSAGTAIGSTVTAADYPVAGSVGDLTGDGIADLYAQNTAGRIVIWPGVVGDPTGHPGKVTGFASGNAIGDPRAPLGRYPLAGPVSSTDTTHTPDALGSHPGTVSGDVTFGATSATTPSNAATFNAGTTNNGEVKADGLTVDTTKSFTVSTWARADQLTDGTVVSQNGAQASNFKLWPATDASGVNWRFAMATSDTAGTVSYDATTETVNSSARVRTGAWTKLVASYNATTHQTALYVNGALAATGTHTTAVTGTGPVVIGHHQANGTAAGPFKGAVADLAVYPFATTPGGSVPGPFVSAVAPGKCMDAAWGGTADGTVIEIWDCNGSGAQNFTIKDDGTVRFGGKCLDATANGTANGTLVELYTCSGGGNQRWIPRADGSLLNPVSGRCLDDPNSSPANGTQLQLWDCNRTNAQTWAFIPLV